MNKKIKLVLILVVVIILILIIVGLIGAYKDNISNYFEERRARAVYNEMLAEHNALEEKKKNDFVGGKTPEETLGMYIEALKIINIDLAKSYYDIEYRDEVLKDPSKIDTIIKNINSLVQNGAKKCFIGLENKEICSWSIKTDSGIDMRIGLEKSVNNIWKIIR